MPSSKGLLIFLLASQLLSIHGQGYYNKYPDRFHPPYTPRHTTEYSARKPHLGNHHGNGDDVILSKTSPPPVDTKSSVEMVNPVPTYRPSHSPYDNNHTQNRTNTEPRNYGPTHSKYRECKPTAPNTILNFASVGLKRIGDAFIKSSETKELYLDNNDITQISGAAFVLLNQLEVLSLSGNKIPIEKLLWFSKTYTLRKLVVDDNRCSPSNVTKVLEALPRLEELSLQRDNISRFVVNLKEFAPRLTHLRLCGNNIDELEFLDDLPDSLSHLYLDDNMITKVRSIALNNVQELSVSGNHIEKLCRDMCSDSFLSLKGMENLQKLNASRNSIAEVTDNAFIDAKNLITLDLSRNKIKTLPVDVPNMLSVLKELFLSHNELGSMPNICSSMRLRYLDLSYNNIGSITNSNLCDSTSNLHTLLLSGNYITDVDNDAFMRLPALKKLDLSNNLILNLPVRLIYGARSLQTLLLRNNSIANIDQLFSVKSKVLQELHLQENPFCTVKYEEMPQLVIHLKDQPRQAKDNEEKEEEKEEDDTTENHDDDYEDENSVNSRWD
ncbi:keratocan [Megachile rotundata]|uniref:keratocan n=1 Tax=Megachile rotundata TaxID=143995 RepID=UPI0006150B04|nr:PREDICTED: platelet glycoprotein V-like [Megachile rotundata]XP_012150087.1 PREDICTED: platelet glycoprotein V-like [Megachile rotundata]